MRKGRNTELSIAQVGIEIDVGRRGVATVDILCVLEGRAIVTIILKN